MTEEAPEIDRDIYPMPTFANFGVTDLVAATHWYEAAGFIVLATLPGGDAPAVVVHLRRMRYQDILLTVGEPTPGATISFHAGEEDLLPRAEIMRERETGAVEGPSDTPWYTSDLTLTDPDGHRIILTAPRLEESWADTEWTESVHTGLGKRPE